MRISDWSSDVCSSDLTESGGPPVRQPLKPGFGCTVIEQTVVEQLGGTVSHMFLPEGVRCRMIVPLLPTEREAVGGSADMGVAAVPEEESKDVVWAGKRILLVEDEIPITKNGRPSCREMGVQAGKIWVVADSLKKNKKK